MSPDDFTIKELVRSIRRIETKVNSMEENLNVILSHEHRISDLETFKRWATRASLGGSMGLIVTLLFIIVGVS